MSAIRLFLVLVLDAMYCGVSDKVTGGENMKAYVCITGQLSRLELKNKIERLLVPLHGKGYSTFIGLVLSEAPPKYSNANNDNGEMLTLQSSIDEVVNELEKVPGVIKVKHIRPRLKGVKFNSNYDMNVGRFKELKNGKWTSKVNMKNHVSVGNNNARQFRTLQFCDHWPGIHQKTDFVVRLREDLLVHTMNFDRILPLVQKGAVVTSECDAWRGINDKLAFAPSTRASDFFRIPYEEYLAFNYSNYDINRLNSEQLYNIAFSKHDFFLSSTDAIVVTKARTYHKGVNTEGVSRNCTVVANPLLPSQMCPEESLDHLSYSAICWRT